MVMQLQKLGKLAYYDTGAPAGAAEYTTVVSIHGLGFHSGGFHKLLPYCATSRTRIVLLNRRDYPGSAEYNEAERAQVEALGASPDALALCDAFARDRAREVFDFLTAFIQQEQNIPEARGTRGGIVLSAWSLGCSLLLSILKHFASFSGNIDLSKYIRRAVLYDPPSPVMGYPNPANPYSPYADDTIPIPERSKRFALWVSGYYNHGPTEETLEKHKALQQPPPSITVMTSDEVQSSFDPITSGMDGLDLRSCFVLFFSGFHDEQRKSVLFPKHKADPWSRLPIRYLYCSQSEWEMVWAERCLRAELEDARSKATNMRDVYIGVLTEANHFIHYDDPKRFLAAILEEDMEKSSW